MIAEHFETPGVAYLAGVSLPSWSKDPGPRLHQPHPTGWPDAMEGQRLVAVAPDEANCTQPRRREGVQCRIECPFSSSTIIRSVPKPV